MSKERTATPPPKPIFPADRVEHTGGSHRPNRLLLVGFIITSVLLLLLIFKQCNRPLPPKPAIVPEKVIKDSVKAATDRAQRLVDSVAKVNAVLLNRVDSGKAAMANIMARAKALKGYNSTILNPPNSRELNPVSKDYLQAGAIGVDNYSNDYAGGDKDAIIAEQADLLQQQDSACTITMGALESMVVNKDAVITAKDTLISAINRQLSVALTNQASLEVYSAKLRKAAKRAKFGRGFWRTAAVGLLGALVYKSIK